MIAVLSPAKSLDYETPLTVVKHTKPQFVDQAESLVEILKPMSPAKLSELMSISDKLAVLNVARYEQWTRRFTAHNSRQALFAFNGDVYDGLNASTLTEDDVEYAQSHFRILSGLYGLLRPLDLMQPYRLEMGTRLPNPSGKDLYAFWKDTLAPALNKEFKAQKVPPSEAVLINLASDEYFKSVNTKELKARVIQPVFKDYKNGQYKIISFFAKKARGLMARYMIDHRVQNPEQLKAFDTAGYSYSVTDSTDNQWVFLRKESE